MQRKMPFCWMGKIGNPTNMSAEKLGSTSFWMQEILAPPKKNQPVRSLPLVCVNDRHEKRNNRIEGSFRTGFPMIVPNINLQESHISHPDIAPPRQSS